MPIPETTVASLVAAYQTLKPETLDALLAYYADTARFRDPFNDVRGRAAIGAVFAHMFATVERPRFEVTGRFASDEGVVLRWNFRFASRRLGGEQCITGLSTLAFDDDGQVVEHLDYWDPAAGLYEKLPGFGWLMRKLRRALAAPVGR
jgi:steroid delta-isomerase